MLLAAAAGAAAMRGAFNMHGSLLPKYRGRAPVNWAILRGETRTGATLHDMAREARRGPHRRPDGGADPARRPRRRVFRKVTVAAELVLDRVAARGAGRHGAAARRRTWRRAATAAAAAPRTAASTGPARAPRSTTWCAPWRRPIRAPSPSWAASACGCCARTWRPARRSPGRRHPALRRQALIARCADGGVLRILECDLDGKPLDAPQFARALRTRAGTPRRNRT